MVEATHSLSFTRPKPYGLAWQNQLWRRDAKESRKSFFVPKRYIFLLRLAVDPVMAGTSVPTPTILHPAGKSVKICGKCKIIHSKCCRNGNFNSFCNKKFILLSIIEVWRYIVYTEKAPHSTRAGCGGHWKGENYPRIFSPIILFLSIKLCALKSVSKNIFTNSFAASL